MRKMKLTMIMLLCALPLAAFLNGCGSSSRESNGSPTDVAFVEESTCAQCHGSAVSSVTGRSIYNGGILNGGYSNSGHLSVGCQGCHGGGAQHWGVGPIPFPKPDQAGRCVLCHNEANTPDHFAPHLVDITHSGIGQVVSATFMGPNAKCTDCHDPHDTRPSVTEGSVFQQWAESGHGDVEADPWIHYDFGAPNRAACARCHTTTGFKMFLENPNAGGWSYKTVTDDNREVLRCDACHNNYSYSIRNGAANGFDAAFLGYSTTIPRNALPLNRLTDAGASNVCNNCHAGRLAGGNILRGTFAQFSSSSFAFNSHYMAATGILHSIIGFENFSTTAASASHAKYVATGFGHADIAVEEGRGPCVGCHFTDDNGPAAHDLEAINADGTLKPQCNACHGAGGLEISIADSKARLQNALGIATTLLRDRYDIIYSTAANPYFFNALAPVPVTAANPVGFSTTIPWNGRAQAAGDTRNTFVAGSGYPAVTRGRAGQRLTGAAFNLNLLTREPGAYAHNNQYSMALIYDTIDYLDNGSIDGDLDATVAGNFASQPVLDAIFGAGSPRPIP
jgi:hypothetical protein